MRRILSLNQNWKFVKDALYAEDAVRQTGVSVTLPHTWNAKDGQDGGNDYHRGICWYVRELAVPETDQEVYLEFQGVAMVACVYLNGILLASHSGGYSTWRVKLSGKLLESNIVAVSVDNSHMDTVYPQKADFTFYGGIYRDVKLITVPREHFELDYFGTPGIKVTPVVDLISKSAEITVETWQNAAEVTISIGAHSITVPSINGYAVAKFTMEDVRLWDGLDDPFLYTARATLSSGDEIAAHFGCRTYEMDPQKGFLLNGRSYPLRGVSRHQDYWAVGNALSEKHHRQDMEIIRDLGANTLRLAHYQHAQEFYELCDEYGIIVWAEIPYITMHMPSGRDNTVSQMTELIVQNYNHPSIVVWGLSNEITAASSVDEDLLENHRLLNELCHELDPTRPTTMAHAFMLEIESPILEIPDINSYNLYFGWYVGTLENTDEFFDAFHTKYPDRVIGFSEYGADANPAFQSATPEKGDYSEAYQAKYHEHMLTMIDARPWLWATHVWNLFDFAADGRDEGGKHGQNQKGLVTFDRKLKKDAFYLYKAAWSKTPFVHLCGRRYVDRPEELTEIKAYSNLPEISLYVDGKPVETKRGHRVFTFCIPIHTEHTVEAVCGEYRDAITIRKVTDPNPEYVFVKKRDIVNWFDQDDFDPDCYSVSDTLGDLRKHPETRAIIDNMMAQSAAARGDIAQSVITNPALQRMLNRMTLISMMKQAGEADDESIKRLNRILQRYKKLD